MSDSIYQQISGGMAQLNNALRDAFLPDGSRMFLLKRPTSSGKLTKIAEITEGYYVRWNEYRGQMQFRLADANPARTDQIALTSYIGFGVPNGSSQIDAFSISLELHDRVPPNGASPFWKLYGVRDAKERYTIEP